MGWIGSNDELQKALQAAGADRDEDGRFLIYGEPPVSFLGMGEEFVVPDHAMYSVGGERRNLAELLAAVGGMKVHVIS